jgi:hypothetical protein
MLGVMTNGFLALGVAGATSGSHETASGVSEADERAKTARTFEKHGAAKVIETA